MLAALPLAGLAIALRWRSSRVAPTADTIATSPTSAPVEANTGTPTFDGDLAPVDRGFVDTQGGTGWGNRCWEHILKQEFPSARAACTRGLAMNPKSPYPLAYLLYDMGVIEIHDGHPDLARPYLRQSLAIRPPSDVEGARAVRQALAKTGVER